MATNIKSNLAMEQTGNGVPTHISPIGSFYFDLDTSILYQNKDGISHWNYIVDSSMIISGGGNSTYITGITFNNNILSLINNSGGTINTLINNLSGLTVNGLTQSNTLSSTTITTYTLSSLFTGGTKSFEVTSDGEIQMNGDNGTDSGVGIHQRDFALPTIIDIYNQNYSKLHFRITDNGSSGNVSIGHSTIDINPYTNNVGIGVSAGLSKLKLKGDSVGQDILNISPLLGGGGILFNSDINNHPYFYLQNSAGTSTQVNISSSGTSYFNSGNVGFGSISPALDAIHIFGGTIRINDVGNTYGVGKLAISDANGSISFSSATELGLSGNSTSNGTYTPTLTLVNNLSTATTYECQYLRVGNTVNVGGKVDIDPILVATSTQLGISLPIASDFGANEDCGGSAFASGIAGQGAAIRGDATNNRAELIYISSDITNQSMYFNFTYQII